MQSQKNILSSERQGHCNNDTKRLTLVSVSIESSLLGHDVKAYEQVVELMSKKYSCEMSDCYNHPEYLNEILKTLPKNSCDDIVESIRKGLGEFSYIDGISKFLDVLSR